MRKSTILILKQKYATEHNTAVEIYEDPTKRGNAFQTVKNTSSKSARDLHHLANWLRDITMFLTRLR